MLGLHNAAPSMAYSLVNVAPSNNIRDFGQFAVGIQAIGEFTGVPAEGADQISVTPVEAVTTSSNDERTSSSSRARMRLSTAPARDSWRSKPSWPGTNSRVMTLDGSAASRCGLRVTSPARTEVIAAQSRSAERAAGSRSPPESTPRPG